MCICLGCRTDFSVCLRDVQETRLCVYEGCGADYSSSDFQLNYIFETSPPCVCAGRDETLLTASSPGSNAIGRRERKQEDANWEVTQRTQTSSRAKAEGTKQGVNKCAVWISIQFGKTSRQSTFPLSLSKSQFVDEEIQRHTVIRPIFWCLLDILDMLASWYEFIAYTLQKAARVANTDPRKRLEQHVIFRLS